ncbi:DUF2968 domain-containing protein [Paraburkholderia tropica]|uniref:DUF2968 domain-containing protein n=1 Tax=Paraburkholderia tropica TaxID=92647 RepID=UPI002AB74E0B|nr:DUF2968 domain-containing protein [Paraburkholderia tropica]
MKSFLNRRRAAEPGGPSHLVAVARDSSSADLAHPAGSVDTHRPAGEPGPHHEAETAHQQSNDHSNDHDHDGAGTLDYHADAATTARMPIHSGGAPRPVSTLHAVPAMPAHLSGRPVQIADGASFEALVATHAMTTFRSFRSFDYTVTLLFHGETLGYFVALHQDGALWHAFRAADIDSAGAVFHHLQEQATRLADGETRIAQLSAQNVLLARQIEDSEAQAERLRVDLQRHAEQEHRVSARQHQVRKDVAQMEAQRIAAQAQLNKAHRTIHQLSVTSSEGVPHLHGR